jgi:hypothetical protein
MIPGGQAQRLAGKGALTHGAPSSGASPASVQAVQGLDATNWPPLPPAPAPVPVATPVAATGKAAPLSKPEKDGSACTTPAGLHASFGRGHSQRGPPQPLPGMTGPKGAADTRYSAEDTPVDAAPSQVLLSYP